MAKWKRKLERNRNLPMRRLRTSGPGPIAGPSGRWGLTAISLALLLTTPILVISISSIESVPGVAKNVQKVASPSFRATVFVKLAYWSRFKKKKKISTTKGTLQKVKQQSVSITYHKWQLSNYQL